MTQKVGVVDTMFARIDLFPEVLKAFESVNWEPEVIRSTVPGFKDAPVEAKRLLDNGCDIVIALTMAGGAEIDKQCAHEAEIGFQHARLATNKHIIGVMVFENEASADLLPQIARDRAFKHSINAYWLLNKPEELTKRAGTGQRQGFENAGPVEVA